MTQEPAPGDQQARTMDRRRFLTAAGVIAAGTVVAGGIAVRELTRDDPEGRAERLVARRRDRLPGDADDRDWRSGDPWPAPMQQQNLVPPFGPEVVIPELRVRAFHDGTELAFFIEWADDAVDELDVMARFRDAVAVQIPTVPGSTPAVTMGQVGQPVHIMQWRASWQADVDRGRRTVQDAFPNMYHDAAPEDLMSPQDATVFYPARAVGNPVAQAQRASPVEDLVAVGFGSLTSHEEQTVRGDAVFDERGWHVVIRTPLSGGADKAQLTPGQATPVAFAAWNGSAANRGARKQWANWTTMEIEA